VSDWTIKHDFWIKEFVVAVATVLEVTPTCWADVKAILGIDLNWPRLVGAGRFSIGTRIQVPN
jgi:hypothetical protein